MSDLFTGHIDLVLHLAGSVQGCHLPPHRGLAQAVPRPGLQPPDGRMFLSLLRRGGSLAASSDDLPTRD